MSAEAVPADEVESSYRYLSGYTAPRPLAEQVAILRRHFPGLAASDLPEVHASPLAEGLFAIPRWQALAPTYTEALALVLGLLEAQRQGVFFNNRAGQLGPEGLHQLPESVAAFERLERQQDSRDILVVPAQFSLRHRGRSVARARQCYGAGEFGLGAFHIAIMVLTHPERLQQEHDLFVDAPGDAFDDKVADTRFGRTPCLCFENGRLEFGTHWTERAYDYNGSATGFLPYAAPAAPLIRPGAGHADEELPTRFAYPPGYAGARPLAEQAAILGVVFPELRAGEPAPAGELPAGAEGWFLVPRWEALAPSYNEALEIVLERLKADRGGRFHNFRRGRLGPESLRQHAQAKAALDRIATAQPGRDLLVVPAQFGRLHAGRSIRRARAMFADNEFGLGALHVAALVLTHPARLDHPDWRRQRISAGALECSGDEYDDAVRRYGRSPCFFCDGGEEEFGTHWIHQAEATSGSVTAFLTA